MSRSIETAYTDQLFSPHDSSSQPSSVFFLIQSNLTNEQSFNSKFSSSSPIVFDTFDFYADSGPQDDGDNFIAKVQRVDIELLENMKRKLSTTRAKKPEGLYDDKINMFDTGVLCSMTWTIILALFRH